MKTTAVVTAVLATLTLGGRSAPQPGPSAADPPGSISHASQVALQEATLEGTWVARTSEEGVPRLHLRRDGDDGRSRTSLPEADARRIVAGARARDGLVEVTLERAAGTLKLEGVLQGERGQGTFTFREDPAFGRRMQELGFRRPDVEELLAAAVFGVDEARVAMLREAGFDPDFDEVLATAIFGVDQDLVRAARSRWGTGELDDLVAMRIHGVTDDFVDGLRAEGLELAELDDALAFRIHGVTPAFVREAQAMGLGPLDADDLVAMKIHGVDDAYLDGMATAGHPLRDLDDALAFRIHGITPAWIEELRTEGFEDLDADDLLRIRIHGLDRILRKRRR